MNSAYALVGLYLFSGLAAGYFCGHVPYSAAKKRGQDVLGMVALGVCLAFGLCLHVFVLFVALGFYAVIVAVGEKSETTRRGYAGLSDEDYRRMVGNRPRQKRESAYQLIGPVVLCNECGHSSSKGEGGEVPPECPRCGEVFRDVPEPPRRVAEAVEVVDLAAAPPT